METRTIMLEYSFLLLWSCRDCAGEPSTESSLVSALLSTGRGGQMKSLDCQINMLWRLVLVQYGVEIAEVRS